ncbi:unnamed protein product [Closterium sp. Naga37s-1]|nr:unnamed protein product [Closterium sp. Naga37s-1]
MQPCVKGGRCVGAPSGSRNARIAPPHPSHAERETGPSCLPRHSPFNPSGFQPHVKLFPMLTLLAAATRPSRNDAPPTAATHALTAATPALTAATPALTTVHLRSPLRTGVTDASCCSPAALTAFPRADHPLMLPASDFHSYLHSLGPPGMPFSSQHAHALTTPFHLLSTLAYELLDDARFTLHSMYETVGISLGRLVGVGELGVQLKELREQLAAARGGVG